jgi:hypothetical protein
MYVPFSVSLRRITPPPSPPPPQKKEIRNFLNEDVIVFFT